MRFRSLSTQYTSEIVVNTSNVKENENTDKEHSGTKQRGVQDDCEIEMEYSLIGLEDRTGISVSNESAFFRFWKLFSEAVLLSVHFLMH